MAHSKSQIERTYGWVEEGRALEKDLRESGELDAADEVKRALREIGHNPGSAFSQKAQESEDVSTFRREDFAADAKENKS